MANFHAPSLYTHGSTNYSTPSFSSTSSSSCQDINSPKHVFSSPLAERYAHGEILGTPTTFDDGHGQENTIDRKFRHRQPSSCFNSISRETFTSSSARKLQSNSKEHQPDPPRHEPDMSNVHQGPREREITKPLLSPISFTCPAAVNAAVDSYASGHQPNKLYQKTANSALASPIAATNGNRCVFPLCGNDPQSAQGEVSFYHAATKDIRGQWPTKPRALSPGNRLQPILPYALPINGEPDGVQLRKSLHRTTASRELRRSAGSMPMDKDCGLWVDEIVRTRCAGSYQQHHDTESRGNTRDGKIRLWLDATKNEDKIQEAHATTVMHNPTKPRVITIARRSSSGSPCNISYSPYDQASRYAGRRPATPPETPVSAVGLGINPIASPVGGRKAWSGDKDSQALFSLTPPNSRLAAPRKSTIRRPSDVSTKTFQVGVSPHGVSPVGLCKNAEVWVIAELEAAVNNHPTARLYLDSPIIQHISSLTKAKSDLQVAGQGKYAAHIVPPHSRYSNLRPLSSHPISPQDVPHYRGIQRQSLAIAQKHHATFAASPSNATLSALRVVFPRAPGALLDSLQATYLALNYVSSLPPLDVCMYTPTSQSSPTSPGLSLSSIPPKALATLGIQAPMPSPVASTSWLRSQRPKVEELGPGRVNSTIEQERIVNLQVSLRISVRGLLGEIDGRRFGKRDESLVRAVGELVRCGEEVVSLSK